LNRVWFLWASCVRVKQNLHHPLTGSSLLSITNEVNLSPKFMPPSKEASSIDMNALLYKTKYRKRLNLDISPLDDYSFKEDILPKCSLCGKPVRFPRFKGPSPAVNRFFSGDLSPLPSKKSFFDSQLLEAPVNETEIQKEAPDTEEIKNLTIFLEEIEDLSYVCNSHFLDSTSNFYFKLPSHIQELISKEKLVEEYWNSFESNASIQKTEDLTMYYIPTTNIAKLQKIFDSLTKDIQKKVEELRKVLQPSLPETTEMEIMVVGAPTLDKMDLYQTIYSNGQNLDSGLASPLSPTDSRSSRQSSRSKNILCDTCAMLNSPQNMRSIHSSPRSSENDGHPRSVSFSEFGRPRSKTDTFKQQEKRAKSASREL